MAETRPEALPPGQIALNVDVSKLNDANVVYANVFAVSGGLDEVCLSVGFAIPPLVIGTPDQQKAQLEGLGPLSPAPIIRIVMSRKKYAELTELLKNTQI